MGLFRPAKVVRQAGRAAPTNFLGYVLLFLAMATGMLNRFLASALWPLLVTLLVLGLSWQYVAGWLDALREWRRPNPSARRPTATPVTKQELQAWLMFNTHVALPAEEQPLDFYQQLYAKHAAARTASEAPPPPTAAAAAAGSSGPSGAVHILADGSATTQAIPPLGWPKLLGALVAGSVCAGVLACIPPPAWCVSMGAYHQALRPSPWLRGMGAALGVWLVGSLPPHAGPLGEALRCALVASLLVDLAGPRLGYLLLL